MKFWYINYFDKAWSATLRMVKLVHWIDIIDKIREPYQHNISNVNCWIWRQSHNRIFNFWIHKISDSNLMQICLIYLKYSERFSFSLLHFESTPYTHGQLLSLIPQSTIPANLWTISFGMFQNPPQNSFSYTKIILPWFLRYLYES